MVVGPRIGTSGNSLVAVKVELALERGEFCVFEVLLHHFFDKCLGVSDFKGSTVGQPANDGLIWELKNGGFGGEHSQFNHNSQRASKKNTKFPHPLTRSPWPDIKSIIFSGKGCLTPPLFRLFSLLSSSSW